MTRCWFNAPSSHQARRVLACTNAPTTMVRDTRPLPDGAMRAPIEACESHAAELIAMGKGWVAA